MKDTVLQKLRWVKTEEPIRHALTGISTEESARYAALKAAIQEAGLPGPPEPMSVADEARYFLKAIAEVEHALLVQYLYAAYSISSGARADRVEVIAIAIEEMGHLITAQNLLLALGSSIHFDRDDTSFGKKPAGEYPFHIRFEPLSLDSLAKYVTTESPPLNLIDDAALRARVEPVFERAEQTAGRVINHVGVLFAYLFWLFQPDDDPHPDWPELPGLGLPSGRHLADSDLDFSSELRQASPEEFGGRANVYVFPISSRNDALQALDKIAEQGEGWKLDPTDPSHFERFLGAYERFEAEISGHILNVPVNPNTSNNPEAPQSRITHEAALRWAKLLNVRYRLTLLELGLAMLRPRDPDDDTPLSRQALIDASLNEMRRGIGRIAIRLTGLPRRADSPPGEVAAAPFELPDHNFPTDETGLRSEIRVALLEARQLMQELMDLPAPNAPSPSDRNLIAGLRTSDDSLLEAIGA